MSQLELPLSIEEKQELNELESIIIQGLETFYDVGSALRVIREKQLYRAEYRTWDEYCQDRWAFAGRHGRRLSDASKVYENLLADENIETNTFETIIPTSERQIRPLTKLEPQQQREAWQQAVNTAPNGKVTPGHVKQIVEEMLPPKPVPTLPQENPYTLSFEDYAEYQNGGTPTPSPVVESQQRFIESKKYHADSRTDSEQFHSKFIWNYQRLDFSIFDHFTIGYSKRNIEQFIEILQLAGVTCLVDIRYNAFSQYKLDFNKKQFSETLASNEIKYIHIPELGIHHDDRKDLADTLDYDGLFNVYRERIEMEWLTTLSEQIDLSVERCAFMCVELDPSTCHRCILSDFLEIEGFKVIDL